MKRDRGLQIKILRQMRGDIPESEVPKLASEVMGYNAALLIKEGLVEGEALEGGDGKYIGAVLTNLTNAGQDFLEELDRSEASPAPKTPTSFKMQIFISHSSKDSELAASLAELFRSAFSLPPSQIRCTSVSGYKLTVGAETDDVLRQEVTGSKVFIGVITPASIESMYVLFELGARWGARLNLSPVLAKGADSSLLRGPLGGINALDMSNEADRMQLISDVGAQLSIDPCPIHSLVTHIQRLAVAAVQNEILYEPSSTAGAKKLKAETVVVLKSIFDATRPLPSNILAGQLQMAQNTFDYHVGILVEQGLVKPPGAAVNMPGGSRHLPEIKITQAGRAFVIEQQ